MKKNKKNKRKYEEIENNKPVEDEVDTVGVINEEVVKKKKKKKSKKKDGDEENNKPESIIKADNAVQEKVSDEEEETDPSPFKKKFYTPSESTEAMTKAEVKEYHAKHVITMHGKGRKKMKPLMKFSDLCFSDSIMSICSGFATPTPIQAQCWPVLAGGRDVIGIAEPGSTGEGRSLLRGQVCVSVRGSAQVAAGAATRQGQCGGGGGHPWQAHRYGQRRDCRPRTGFLPRAGRGG